MDHSSPPRPDASGAPAPRLVRFVDPTEAAFSLVLPEDWRVQSGVVRAPSEARPWYRALSPGGRAELRGCDPRVPMWFVDPSFAMMAMPMPGVPMRPYTPPMAFAEEYARHFAREAGAATFTPTGVRDVEEALRDDTRPDARSKFQILMQGGAEFAGVTFTCPDRARSGLVDVVNLRMAMPVGLMWSPIITALLGPSDAWPHVRATLLAIARSYATNPAWQQRQSQLQQMNHQAVMGSIETGNRILRMQAQSGMEAIHAHAQRAHMAAQTSDEIHAMRMDSWRQQQASGDESQRRAVNAVRETVDLYDPSTGQVYRGAPAGFASYWTDGAERVVASEGDENPDASRFTQAVDLDDVRRPPRG